MKPLHKSFSFISRRNPCSLVRWRPGLDAVRLLYEEGKTRAQITAQLAILDANRVKMRQHQYRQDGVAASLKKPRRLG